MLSRFSIGAYLNCGSWVTRNYSKKSFPTNPRCPEKKESDKDEKKPDPQFELSRENQKRAELLLKYYPPEHIQGALLPLLDLAQRQHGWLPIGALYTVSKMLNMQPFQVFEIASFYPMFKMKPQGKYKVHVCTTTPCCLRGADEIMEKCKQELQLAVGETSKDMKFTLAEAECLGACVHAPVVVINDDYYEDLTPEDVKDIFDCLKKDQIPQPGPRSGRFASEPLRGLTTLKRRPPPPGFRMQNLDAVEE